VIKRVAEGASDAQLAARARLASEGWAAKAAQFAQVSLAELPAHSPKESYIS
jgi:hypothetical protein